jgi:hypothetical protein
MDPRKDRISRRRLLTLGGIAAIGAAGSLVVPAAAAGRQPPGQLKKQARVQQRMLSTTPTREPTATPAPASTPAPIGAPASTATPEPTGIPAPTSTATPPATGLYRALDTDFGASGVQPQSWFDAARAAGYEGFVTTLHTYWDGRPRAWLPSHDALNRALAAGMWVAAYGRPVSYWREALQHLPRDLRAQLKFFALDVEPEPGTNVRVRRDDVDGVRSMGVRPVIYSGWGMWGDVMGSDSSFADVPLWDFAGDRRDWPASIIEAPMRAYAGWNVPGNYRVGWQVQMQTPAVLNGIYIDRDLFTRGFIDAG